MKNIYSLFLLLACIVISCNDGDNTEPLVNRNPLNKAPLWESERLAQPDIRLKATHHFEVLPTYNNTMMTSIVDKNNKIRYVGLDVETGEQKWISDYFSIYRYSLFESTQIQIENIVYIIGVERNFEEGNPTPISSDVPILGFDITTGELVYKKSFAPLFRPREIKQKGEFVVVLDSLNKNEDGSETPHFHYTKLPLSNNHWTDLEPPLLNNLTFNNTYQCGIVGWELAESDGDTFLIYMVNEPSEEGALHAGIASTLFHFSCYNLSKQEWVYQKKPSKGGFTSIPIVDDLIHFFATDNGSNMPWAGLWTYQWKTGEFVWHMDRKDFDDELKLSFGQVKRSGNMMISFALGYMYGIDARNGRVVWKKRGNGNDNSTIFFHNGVAYTVSRGGYLHGVDVQTGERLLKAECPSDGKLVDNYPLESFQASIGKHFRDDGSLVLLTQNFMYAYAFDAVR